jgi:glycoside/pentoside/hexuronide:cation symporter, GPH family
MSDSAHPLSFREKAGYSLGDAAANFVFMTMILFQSNFYTDVFGLTAFAAGNIILVARLWDAFFDPVMGVIADRTNTRWGRFRPWILWTAVPWGVVMYLAYSTPSGWSNSAMIAYAAITNILLMTLYSMNNMPYAALGGVMTADVDERANLNSFRFVAATMAQFLVGGLTLPLVAKFSSGGQDRSHGWAVTMGLWAAVCLVCFLITFATTKERIQPEPKQKSTPRQDFGDLLRNSPWMVMFAMTLIHFAILSLRGSANYNYYHSFADKTALFDWLQSLGLTAPPLAAGAAAPGGILEWLGYVVHADRANLASSNVADVANSIINMIDTALVIIVILLSPKLARRFGKKAIAVVGFALITIVSFARYFLEPTNVGGMVAMTVLGAVVYAPTIPLIWAMFADVADYSEWKNNRRATGIIFATICFALKAGLSLGSASWLWLMSAYGYVANQPQTAQTLHGIRVGTTVVVGILFAICTLLLLAYKINHPLTHQIARELAERRKKFAEA